VIVPQVRQFGDVVVALFAGTRIVMEFTKFHEHRDALSAEITVSTEAGELHWSRLNLAATNGRHQVVKALEEVHPLEGWRGMLDGACQAVARHLRSGEPCVPMVPTPPSEDRWLVPGLIPLHETTIIYADGGSGKSLFGLALLLSGLTQHALGGPWRVAPIRHALYLDWESMRRAHEGRLWGLTRHLEEPPPGRLLHRRLWRPLMDEIGEIRTTAAKEHTDVVIADSLAPASGVDPEGANASTSTFNALASLEDSTRIVLAHMSHAGMESGHGRPYGSVFNRNLARSAIEIKADESEDQSELTMTMYHRKMNEGRKQPPSALTFSFAADGAIDVSRAEPDHSGASLAGQILAALRPGKQTVTALAEQTGRDAAVIRSTLSRMASQGNRSKVLRFERSSGGKGQETQWGLRDANRNTLGD